MRKLYGVLDNERGGWKTYTAQREISSQLKTKDTTADMHMWSDGRMLITVQRGSETVYLTIGEESDLDVTEGTLNPLLETSKPDRTAPWHHCPVVTLHPSDDGSK